MPKKKERREEFRVSGEEVVAKVKKLIHEGSIRKIIIKNEKGDAVMEIPLAIGAIGALVAPALAALGAAAAILSKCTIVVIKEEK